MERLIAWARSPLGRILGALVGLAAVVAVVAHVGFTQVVTILYRSAAYFPLIALCEVGILAGSMAALRELYGDERDRMPIRALIRAGLIGYAVMGLVPAGRAAAEAARAVLLARYTSGPRAAAAAAQLQGIALLANGAIALPAVIATGLVLGPSIVPAAILGFGILALVLGAGVLAIGRRSRLGAWVGKKAPKTQEFGAAFDAHLQEAPAFPISAFLFELGSRAIQVFQNALLVAAVGGIFGLIPALSSEGIHLVGAGIGDLIPGQLGATEVIFTLAPAALGLAPRDAIAIALLAHLAQLLWVVVGILVPVLWPPGDDEEPSPPRAEAVATPLG